MKIQIHNKQNVYFCSDPHYHHKQLIRGTSSWKDKKDCRNFNNLSDHDNVLVDNINQIVRENDILFCLGDWSFGSYNGENINKISEFRYRINCKNIHLILGNHDQEIRDNVNNIQQIFTSVSHYKELYISEQSFEQGVKPHKQHFCLMHYPIRSWNKMRKGSIMLHGHCHNSLPSLVVKNKIQRTMDVGFDANEFFRPFSYSEIMDIMKSRTVFTEDHH